VLDVHVAALRRKLVVPGLIETAYGRVSGSARSEMARRIVLTMLALIGALLVTTVVPLGLITTGHERSSFREDTMLSPGRCPGWPRTGWPTGPRLGASRWPGH